MVTYLCKKVTRFCFAFSHHQLTEGSDARDQLEHAAKSTWGKLLPLHKIPNSYLND